MHVIEFDEFSIFHKSGLLIDLSLDITHRWNDGLNLDNFESHSASNEKLVLQLKDLSEKYIKAVSDEQEMPHEKRAVANVGKMDAKKHMQSSVQTLMSSNILQCMGTMLDTVVF